MNKNKIDKLAKKIWNYLLMNQRLEKSDAIIVLGGYDFRVAERGVELFKEKYAPLIIFSGGYGKITGKLYGKTESRRFSEIAAKNGVAKKFILLEEKSLNTGENAKFVKKLIQKHKLIINKAIVVTKPYGERRGYATFKKQWPKLKIIVSSPKLSFEEYPDKLRNKEELIHVLVGQLQRIKLYPQKSFIIKQTIPREVWLAYKELVSLGFVGRLVQP